MVNQISRREVLNNLIRFKDNLLEMRGEDRQRDRGEEREEGKKGERTYKVLLNRRTGDMRFAQKISTIEQHISRKGTRKESMEDWKEVHLIVQQDAPKDPAHFEVRDSRNHSLEPTDLDPLAWRIASETLNVLNARAKEINGTHKEMLPEEEVLHDLTTIHLSQPKEQIEDLPGWKGSLSRIEAERKLSGKPVGTYLLREGDEITLSMSFHFAEENLLSVHPYLLTVVEQNGKIVDILLLQTNKGWILYHDDPNLKDPLLYHYQSSVQGLLRTISFAHHPLS
jgi:hypothetical protein